MKKIYILALAICFVLIFYSQTLKVPVKSPASTIKQSVALSEITIEYSRPNKNGRIIFGDLLPYNTLWRTGANSPTKITFGEDVFLEKNEVKAGTYSIFTIPNEKEWILILNKNLQIWGTDGYNEKDDVLRINLPVKKTSEITESFTIQFSDVKQTTCNIDFLWDNVKISASISVNIDEKVMKNIESVMLKDKLPYHQAATYYFENNKDLNQALIWANKAFELNPNAYWSGILKAKILFSLNRKSEAKDCAEIVKKLAQNDNDANYVKEAESIILKCK